MEELPELFSINRSQHPFIEKCTQQLFYGQMSTGKSDYTDPVPVRKKNPANSFHRKLR